MARCLTIYPTAAAAAQALGEMPGGEQIPGDLAQGFLSFALDLAARHRPMELPSPSLRLLLALQAADAAGLGVPVAAAGAFARSLSELHGSGLSPAQLISLGPRARGLGRAFEAHKAALAARALSDAGGVAALAAAAVQVGGFVPAVEAIRIEPRLHWTEAELALISALAARLPVEVVLPEAWPEALSRTALFSPLDSVHQELTSGPRAVVVARAIDEKSQPALRAALGGLFGQPCPTEAIEANLFGSVADEARAVACAVRALLRRGTPPDEIAVVGLEPPARQLRAALGLAGIPLGPAPESLAAQRAGQTALTLVRAAADGIPRETLCELLEGGVFAVPHSSRWARLLREAGSGDLRSGRLWPPLDALLARARAEGREVPEGHAELGRVVAALASLPENASLPAFARALWKVLHETRALERLRRRPERPLETAQVATAQLSLFDDPAAGREVRWELPFVEVAGVEALEAVEQLQAVFADFEALPQKAERSILELATLLTLALEDTPGWRVPALPGGVAVGSFEALAGRRFSHLFVVGLSGDGGGVAEESFLSEAIREAARETFSRPALFAKTSAAAVRARERLSLLFAGALATEAVHASGARTAEGQSLAPSPLLAEMGRASAAGLRHVALRPWPALGEGALTRDEVAAALGFEPAAATVAAVEPDLASRHAVLRSQRIGRERALVERRTDPYAGDLTALDLREPLARALAFGAERPLSATTLERLAGCGFRALATTVLRLRVPDERDEALDSRDRGTLSHSCLEAGFRALRSAGLLPLAGRFPGERRQREIETFSAAVGAELDRAERDGQGGHPALWEAHRRRAERELLSILAAEQQQDSPFVPSEFELGFGPDAGADRRSPELSLGTGPILLGGFIDRVDRAQGRAQGRAPERVRVVDYKSGRVEHRRRRLLAEFAKRDLQLGHYALLFKIVEPEVEVDAVYYSIRDAKYSPSLADACREAGVVLDDFLAVRPEARAAARGEGRPNLVNRVEDVLGEARAGNFPVSPGDCSYCDFRAACRVGRLYEEWE